MLTMAQAKQRVQQLVNQDNSTDQGSNSDYNACMMFISAHLYAFYQRYASQNGLTVQQTRQVTDNWDKQQWINAIQSLDTQGWPKEAVDRVKAYGAAAGIDKAHMMANIAKVALVAYAVKQHSMISKRIQKDGAEQVQFMAKHMNLNQKQIKGVSHVTEQARQDLWSANLWSDTDKLANDVENLVNQHLRHGMSLNKLHSILEVHANPKQFKPNQSISDRVHQMEFNARRIVRTESANLVNHVNMATYRQVGVTMVAWLTEPGACDKCTAIAESGPYQLNSSPQPPDDSHPQCRCYLVPVGTRYQRYITIPKVF